MTQAQLADELGLSDASLNYHMKILKKAGLVAIMKKVAEGHGIIQKFFSPAAYLFVYDLDALPKNIARYFYPVSIERSWGMVGAFSAKDDNRAWQKVPGIDGITLALSRMLVETARPYARKETAHGNEGVAYEIYSKAVKAWIDQKDAPRPKRRQRTARR